MLFATQPPEARETGTTKGHLDFNLMQHKIIAMFEERLYSRRVNYIP